jgi:hypothetical protein
VRLVQAKVTSVIEASEAHQKLLVEYCETNKQDKRYQQNTQVVAINYLDLAATCFIDDTVLINVTGLDLDLGTGGFAFVVPTKAQVKPDKTGGHIIKLRYTPLQREYCTVEEQNSPYHDALKTADSLQAMPVVCCELHSQVPLVAAAIKHIVPNSKVAYCMTDQAALPLALSDIIRASLSTGLVDSTITCGQAFGGEYESVNTYSGLLAAKYVANSDVAIVAIGPGTPGSATVFGHGGVAQGEALNAVNVLNGQAIAVLRLSFADKRSRHYGLSHHTLAVLSKICLSRVDVAVPDDIAANQMEMLNSAIQNSKIMTKHNFIRLNSQTAKIDMRGLEVTTMGRSRKQDPAFFSAAYAAGILAAKKIQS